MRTLKLHTNQLSSLVAELNVASWSLNANKGIGSDMPCGTNDVIFGARYFTQEHNKNIERMRS